MARDQFVGRPRLGEEKNRPCYLGFRVAKGTRREIERRAKIAKCSMGDVVNEILEKELAWSVAVGEARAKKRDHKGE